MGAGKRSKYFIKLVLLALVVSLVAVVRICSAQDNPSTSTIHEIAFFWLNLAIDILHLLACVIIVMGSILMATRYLVAKMKSPLKPIEFKPFARYLIVGLDILIGAELLATATAETIEHSLMLLLVIAARFLIAFLIHMERKWEETA